MSLLSFQLPDKIVMEKADDFHGIFTFSPLQPGYGLTIGNAVRRVLLSSLEGYAVTGIKIPGIQHEFSTIDGIVEDVSEIIKSGDHTFINLQFGNIDRNLKEINQKSINIIHQIRCLKNLQLARTHTPKVNGSRHLETRYKQYQTQSIKKLYVVVLISSWFHLKQQQS